MLLFTSVSILGIVGITAMGIIAGLAALGLVSTTIQTAMGQRNQEEQFNKSLDAQNKRADDLQTAIDRRKAEQQDFRNKTVAVEKERQRKMASYQERIRDKMGNQAATARLIQRLGGLDEATRQEEIRRSLLRGQMPNDPRTFV